jgi:hypothetical protein
LPSLSPPPNDLFNAASNVFDLVRENFLATV